MTASLLDEKGFQVWSATFDRELGGIFAIQTDIADDVAQQLNREIVPRPARRGATTSNTDAYNEFLVGRDHTNRRGAGWQIRAAESFGRAISLDPQFAAPHAGLAIVTTLMPGQDPAQLEETLITAQAHIDKALSIDPELADAHAAQGLQLIMGQNPDFAAAEEALRRAIDLDANFMNAWNWLSISVGSQGRLDESTEIQRRALEIDMLVYSRHAVHRK